MQLWFGAGNVGDFVEAAVERHNFAVFFGDSVGGGVGVNKADVLRSKQV